MRTTVTALFAGKSPAALWMLMKMQATFKVTTSTLVQLADCSPRCSPLCVLVYECIPGCGWEALRTHRRSTNHVRNGVACDCLGVQRQYPIQRIYSHRCWHLGEERTTSSHSFKLCTEGIASSFVTSREKSAQATPLLVFQWPQQLETQKEGSQLIISLIAIWGVFS